MTNKLSMLFFFTFFHFSSLYFFEKIFFFTFLLIMSNNNNNNNNNMEEEIEIINISKEGMSYAELKRLHTMSMSTSNNISRILLLSMSTPTPLTSSTSSPSTSLTPPTSLTPSTSSTSLSSTPLTQSTPMVILFSSENVVISKANSNWLTEYYPFKESCRICHYFGHSFKCCPNIRSDFRGVEACLNCWQEGHFGAECTELTRVPPYNNNFKSPEEIINFLLYK